MTEKKIHILLVEDDVGDVELAQTAVRMANVPFHFHAVEDGVEALEYLKRARTGANGGLPDLMLIDLNLPRLNGRELIRDIRADDVLRKIPIAIFSTSTAPADLVKEFSLRPESCYVKP